MIYIASPFTHANPAVEAQRFTQVSHYAHKLFLAGTPAFSPIVYGYHFHTTYKTPGDFEAWSVFNTAMLGICTSVHIYCLPGWNKSKGVAVEIAQAEAQNKPIELIAPVL